MQYIFREKNRDDVRERDHGVRKRELLAREHDEPEKRVEPKKSESSNHVGIRKHLHKTLHNPVIDLHRAHLIHPDLEDHLPDRGGGHGDENKEESSDHTRILPKDCVVDYRQTFWYKRPYASRRPEITNAPPEDPGSLWEQADIPEPGILTATEAHRLIYDAIEVLKIAGRRQNDEEAILGIIAKPIGCEPGELKLGGPTEIAKGNASVLALGSDQNLVAHFLYQVPAGAFVGRNKVYATISHPLKRTRIEALVKYAPQIRGQSGDHLVISEQLAEELKVNPQQLSQIVIETMYQKGTDINLDEL